MTPYKSAYIIYGSIPIGEPSKNPIKTLCFKVLKILYLKHYNIL